MRSLFVNILALSLVFGIYIFDGWKGLVIAILMILLFEFMHWRVYGKSIARIGD